MNMGEPREGARDARPRPRELAELEKESDGLEAGALYEAQREAVFGQDKGVAVRLVVGQDRGVERRRRHSRRHSSSST